MMSRLFVAMIAVVCLAVLPADEASASASQIVRVEPVLRDAYLSIDADVDVDLNAQLRDAAERGVTLYFTADLAITEPRWWWFDRTVVETTRTWRVTYSALTRQWRVSTDESVWPVESLDEALQELRQIRDWRVADVAQFASDIPYQGALRLRLDTSQLARPLQVNALNSSAWSLETRWAAFSFTLNENRDTP